MESSSFEIFPNQSPKSTWRFIYNVYVHQYSDFTFQLLSVLIIFSIIYKCVSFHDGPDIRNWCKTLGNRFVFSVSMWQPVYKPWIVYPNGVYRLSSRRSRTVICIHRIDYLWQEAKTTLKNNTNWTTIIIKLNVGTHSSLLIYFLWMLYWPFKRTSYSVGHS